MSCSHSVLISSSSSSCEPCMPKVWYRQPAMHAYVTPFTYTERFNSLSHCAGTMVALRLLHQAAADACHWHGMTSRPPHETLEELDGLAQAADVPPKWVAELTAHCIANRQYAQAGVLLQIPSAEQMDCGQLCKLVGMAHGGGRHAARLYNSLASALGRCGAQWLYVATVLRVVPGPARPGPAMFVPNE
jgi:hypothetical protein